MNRRIRKHSLRNKLPLAAFAFCVSALANSATFLVGDHVANPTQVNGFEGLVDYIYLQSSYSEDGIRVEQINANSSVEIWTTYGSQYRGFPGERSWYPNGGDYGYTQITQANGADFGDVSIVTGSGWSSGGPILLHYALLNNGLEILSGMVVQTSSAFPVSFLGGGFDAINLTATNVDGDVTYNGLAIDQIEAVPVPAAAWLFGSGLVGLLGTARRRKAA